MTDGSVEASFALGAEISRQPRDGVTVLIPSGSRVSVTAHLAGIPTSAAGLRISSIVLSLSDNAVSPARARPGLAERPLEQRHGRVRRSHLGELRGDTEDLGTALLEFLAIAQVQADPLSAGRIREDLRFRDDAHRLIDEMMRDELDPIVRSVILQNAGAVPGLNLAQVMGVEGAAVPAPAPFRGRARSAPRTGSA